MKILKFQATNIKGIRVVEIAPDGDVVTISGANGAGKSTVLDSIERTLCGGGLALSRDAEKGSVELDMGEYTVSRIITQKTDRLVIKNKDGAQYPSPRTFLEKFVGPLSIDPLSFIRLKDKDQMEVLFRLCPDLRESLEKANAEIDRVKGERSETLREVSRLKVEVEKAPHHKDAPEEPPDTAELAKELQAAQAENEEIEKRKLGLVAIKQKAKDQAGAMAEARAEAVKLRAKLAELLARLATEESIEGLDEALKQSQTEADETEAELAAVHPVDTAPIYSRMSEAGDIANRVRENRERRSLEASKAQADAEYSRLGQALKDAEAAKAQLLAEAQMPIPGLSVNGQAVTYNEIPVCELSTSEKIRVGAAIAKAQKPKAEVILVDDASLLDQNNMALLQEMLSGYQMWVVLNDTTAEKGFYIEDGTVRQKGGTK